MKTDYIITIVLIATLLLTTFVQAEEKQADFDFSKWGGFLKISGEHSGDMLGCSVVLADFDGDGWQDLIMGAPQSDASGGRLSCGKVYVVYGKPGFEGNYSLNDSFIDKLVLVGDQPFDQLGYVIDAADVNGDNKDDLLLGVPMADAGGVNDRGRVYVIFGRAGMTSQYDISSYPEVLVIDGDGAGDQFGFSVSSGDIDDNGTMDLLVGAPLADPETDTLQACGEAYVIPGPLSSGTGRATDLASTVIFGNRTDDRLGSSVLVLDFDENAGMDIFLGAPNADLQSEQRERGIAYLFFGSSALPPKIELAGDDSADVTVAGPETSSGFGLKMVGGDLNGDGKDDAVIGAPGGGGIFVLKGDTSYSEFMDLTYTDVSLHLTPESGSDSLGIILSTGDYNGDGRDDLFAGIPAGNSDRGKAYIIDGVTFSGESKSVAQESKCFFEGDRNGERLGQGVFFGDFDHDDKPDFFAASPVAEANGKAASGIVYMVKGGTPYLSELYPGDGESGVPVDFDMEFWIMDDLSSTEEGVDLSSFEINLSGQVYSVSDFDTTGSAGSSAVHVKLDINPGTFEPNMSVDAEITGNDEGGNPIPSTNYIFRMITDYAGPWLANMAPPDSSKFNPVKPEIRFDIIDDASGVDLDEVWMHITYDTTGGIPVTENFHPVSDTTVSVDTISTSPLGYRIRYLPSKSFPMGDEVEVRIDGKDFAGFPLKDPRIWRFTIVDNDTIPPIIKNELPANGAVGVEVKAVNVDGISFSIFDEQTGVDPATITIERTFEGLSGDTTVSIDSGDTLRINRVTANLYTVWYRPTGDYGDPQFQYSENARFRVRASDLAYEPNEMDTLYSFRLETDINPPEITNRNPNPNNVDSISVFSPISFDITDDKSGVDENSIVFMVNNILTDTEPLRAPNDYNGWSIEYPNIPDTLKQKALPAGPVEISVQASDKVGNAMAVPEVWNYIAMPDSRKPVVSFKLEKIIVELTDSLGNDTSLVTETIPESDYLLNVIPRDSLKITITLTDTTDEWESGIDMNSLSIWSVLANEGGNSKVLVDKGHETHIGYKSGSMNIIENESSCDTVSFNMEELSIAEEVKLSVQVADFGGNEILGELTFNVTYGDRINKPFPPIITPGHGTDPNNRTAILFLGSGTDKGTFTVYDVNSRKVYIEKSIVPVGSVYKVTWGGEFGSPESPGSLVPSGLYVYQFKAGKNIFNGTIAVAR